MASLPSPELGVSQSLSLQGRNSWLQAGRLKFRAQGFQCSILSRTSEWACKFPSALCSRNLCLLSLQTGESIHQRAESFDPPNRTEDRALLRSSGGARSAVYPSQASGVITRPFKKYNTFSFRRRPLQPSVRSLRGKGFPKQLAVNHVVLMVMCSGSNYWPGAVVRSRA